ncbi:unnamed protein product [Haemonchus placei]|uniref:Sema domain-containing protein n=1 Tax=Haemonchus placei TaxID=6290 RepID=A0A0N4WSB8_HAEPC|nr:unnamed protein product [Haemonchus placei]
MVVDPSNTRLYVAGVNYLYDLHSSDLSVRVEAVTGPMDDSDQCKGGAYVAFFLGYFRSSLCILIRFYFFKLHFFIRHFVY